MSQQEQQLQEFYEMKLKIAELEDKLQIAEAAHFEEKIALLEEKQIQENKYAELETKMREILAKVKNVANPEGTFWKESSTIYVTISSDGLQAKVQCKQTIFATQGFPISGEHCRKNPFLWTIYYYEVKQMSQYGFAFWAGLSNGDVDDDPVGWVQNSYSVPSGCDFYLNCGVGAINFEWPERAIKPEWKGLGDVVGCGVLIGRNGKFSLFFTLNGILLGRQIPIEPEYGKRLFPTVTIWDMTLEANFGDDLVAKPFMYDSLNCPGLDLK